MNNSITDIAGISVGHAHNENALTGCTVILCPDGATGGIDRRGGGTSTRQADGMEPWHLVEKVHGILLAGGSAYGLGASSGVMRYLEERGIGFGVGANIVPIVPTAILFDLGIGDGSVRPGPDMAYEACVNANAEHPASGCVGAGMGATVGKSGGLHMAVKAGIGTASKRVGNTDLVVAAIVAVNAFGDIVDSKTSQIIAGVRNKTGEFADALQVMASWAEMGYPRPTATDNTVIGVIVTNAKLSKVEASKVAAMAQNGLAKTVRPAHLMFDGDTIFTLATGEVETHVNVVGAYAAEVFAEAILDGVWAAAGMGGLPSASEMATREQEDRVTG